MNIINLY